MRIFIGLCGSVKNGYESSSRGEGRWALSLVRCLKDRGHEIYMAPDTEPCDWGTCPKPSNVHMVQAWEKTRLNHLHFDVAIFTSWQTETPEAQYIHANKYIWGIMGWKNEIMKDGFFYDNDYVARWFRADLPAMPKDINFSDRCMLLAQPFGNKVEDSKFLNRRVAWVAKECFLPSTHKSLNEAGVRHLSGVIDACIKTDSGLSIFSAGEFNPNVSPILQESGLLSKLSKVKNLTYYPSLPFKEYQRELAKCSVTMPICFAGSIQESIMAGLLPVMYRDSMFSDHPWIEGVCSDLTHGKMSRYQDESGKKDILSEDQISDITAELLTDKIKYDEFLYRLRPMVVDNLDDNVVMQLMKFMNHKCGTSKVRI